LPHVRIQFAGGDCEPLGWWVIVSVVGLNTHPVVASRQGEDVKPSKVKLVTDVLCQAYDKLETGSTDTAAETGEYCPMQHCTG
jgi:hypothetical protein